VNDQQTSAAAGQRTRCRGKKEALFENSIPGLPERAAKEGLKPLEYMRRYGSFEVKNKIAALHAGKPAAIITANIGCQSHLQTATGLPVTHWIEALDARLA